MVLGMGGSNDTISINDTLVVQRKTRSVRLRTNKDGTLANVGEISKKLKVDITTGACAWKHRGGGWYILDYELSDKLAPIEGAA